MEKPEARGTEHNIWFEGQQELALRHEAMKARQARQAARRQYTAGSPRKDPSGRVRRRGCGAEAKAEGDPTPVPKPSPVVEDASRGSASATPGTSSTTAVASSSSATAAVYGTCSGEVGRPCCLLGEKVRPHGQ